MHRTAICRFRYSRRFACHGAGLIRDDRTVLQRVGLAKRFHADGRVFDDVQDLAKIDDVRESRRRMGTEIRVTAFRAQPILLKQADVFAAPAAVIWRDGPLSLAARVRSGRGATRVLTPANRQNCRHAIAVSQHRVIKLRLHSAVRVRVYYGLWMRPTPSMSAGWAVEHIFGAARGALRCRSHTDRLAEPRT